MKQRRAPGRLPPRRWQFSIGALVLWFASEPALPDHSPAVALIGLVAIISCFVNAVIGFRRPMVDRSPRSVGGRVLIVSLSALAIGAACLLALALVLLVGLSTCSSSPGCSLP